MEELSLQHWFPGWWSRPKETLGPPQPAWGVAGSPESLLPLLSPGLGPQIGSHGAVGGPDAAEKVLPESPEVRSKAGGNQSFL